MGFLGRVCRAVHELMDAARLMWALRDPAERRKHGVNDFDDDEW